MNPLPRQRFAQALSLALCAATLSSTSIAQSPPPHAVSGIYGDGVLQLAVPPDNSTITGYFFDQTGAGQFSCGFLLYAVGPPSPDGTYKVSTWWPLHEFDPHLTDDELIIGQLRISGSSVILRLPKQAHGGCWNVNPELDQGEDVLLDRNSVEPTWHDQRVVLAQKLRLYPSPDAATPTHAYLVQGDVLNITETHGS